MNPWSGLIIVVAILLFIIAWKGTQDNVLSAILNRPYTGGQSGSGGTTTATFSSLPGSPATVYPPLQGTTPMSTPLGNLPVGQA